MESPPPAAQSGADVLNAAHIQASIAASSLVTYLLLDADLRLVFFNQTADQAYRRQSGAGLSPGESILHYLLPERRETILKNLRAVLAGERLKVEAAIPTLSGQTWAQAEYQPVRAASGEVVGVSIIAVEVTARKQAELKLERDRANLEKIFHNLPLPMGVSTRAGRVLHANQHLADLLGCTVEQVHTRPVYELGSWENPLDLAAITDKLNSDSHAFVLETSWRRLDGKVIEVLISAVPIDLPEGPSLIGVVLDITARKNAETESERLLTQVNAGRERLRSLARQVIEIQENERRRIANELHHEAGQALTALAMSLELMAKNLEPAMGNHTEAQRQLYELSSLTRATLEGIRRLAHELRPPALETVGLTEALAGACRQFEQRTGLQVYFTASPLPELTDESQISLYRCLQEGLTNVVRHARASRVEVRLSCEGGWVRLAIQDDGAGIQPPQPGEGGIGLQALHERAELLGGHLELGPAPGGGTRLTIFVPAPGEGGG